MTELAPAINARVAPPMCAVGFMSEMPIKRLPLATATVARALRSESASTRVAPPEFRVALLADASTAPRIVVSALAPAPAAMRDVAAAAAVALASPEASAVMAMSPLVDVTWLPSTRAVTRLSIVLDASETLVAREIAPPAVEAAARVASTDEVSSALTRTSPAAVTAEPCFTADSTVLWTVLCASTPAPATATPRPGATVAATTTP